MSHVNRDYSQFEEIRNYQDRGMMKWQGFFLSEHTREMYLDSADKIYYTYLVRGQLK
mgnify:CR=1 FL=1